MESRHVIMANADQLPEKWDCLAGENIFLRKAYLTVLEKTNPCGQEYHLFYAGTELDSILVTYRLRLDIFTYSFLDFKLPVTIVGIPCSVSKPGLRLGERSREAVWAFLSQIQGGKLVLNVDEKFALEQFVVGTTLPTCKLAVRWDSFAEYLADLRSHYRYRLKKAMKRWQGVEVVEVAPREFGPDLYNLYVQVYEKSEFKLERLPLEFFQTFPAKIIAFRAAGQPLAFVQLLENGAELIFVLGGFDYALNHGYDIYLNILMEILQRGITGGFAVIDFGQTAEDTKLKLGSTPHRKYMYYGHSNRWIHGMVQRFPGLFTYQEKAMHFTTFRS